MPKLGRRAILRRRERAEKRDRRRVAGREKARLQRADREREEERKRIASEVDPILRAWQGSMTDGKAPLLHEFVIHYGVQRGWTPQVIQELIDLTAKSVNLLVGAKTDEVAKDVRSKSKLPLESKIMLDVPLDIGSERPSLRSQLETRAALREKGITVTAGSSD